DGAAGPGAALAPAAAPESAGRGGRSESLGDVAEGPERLHGRAGQSRRHGRRKLEARPAALTGPRARRPPSSHFRPTTGVCSPHLLRREGPMDVQELASDVSEASAAV